MVKSNAQLAELLARAAEQAEGNAQKAFRRASRRAFIWPVEAATLIEEGGSLRQLAGVGPFLAKELQGWIEGSVEIPEPDPTRKDFLTFTDCARILRKEPTWRTKLKGDLQMHTDFSDGHATLEEMADAAQQLGHQYISITDHSKGLKIAGGIDEEELARQRSAIDSLNGRLAESGSVLRILASIELNLDPAGQGDMESDALRKLDLVLGSFHSSLRKTDDQTERYLAALRNPDLHILGHPRGRIYNFRLGLQADWMSVFEEAARLDKAVEIDAFPDRQDLNVELLRLAASSDVRISLGTDAHYPDQLSFIDFGLAAALEAGISEKRIVNFMSADEIKTWVETLRH